MEGFEIFYTMALSVLLYIAFTYKGAVKDRQWRLVEYNWFAKLFSVSCFVIMVVVLHAAITAEKKPHLIVYVVLGVLVLGSLLLLVETVMKKIWFDDLQIHYQSSLGKRRSFPIAVIAECKIIGGEEFQITTYSGLTLTISKYMSGGLYLYTRLRNGVAD